MVWGNKWTLVKLHVARLWQMVESADLVFFRAAAVLLPWDMTRGEVDQVERNYPAHVRLRDKFFSGEPYYGSTDGQEEFGTCKSDLDPILFRLKGAHPVSWNGVQYEEWNRLRQDWINFDEYVQFSDIGES